MNNNHRRILNRIYEAETQDRLPCQLKSKYLAEMEAEGLIQQMTVTLPGRFPVIIKGWQLTELARLTWCMSGTKIQ